MKLQVLHLPTWSVFVPALFPTAVSLLLSSVLTYSGARGEVSKPWSRCPEVEAGIQCIPFLRLGERRQLLGCDLPPPPRVKQV